MQEYGLISLNDDLTEVAEYLALIKTESGANYFPNFHSVFTDVVFGRNCNN